ncbi:hypothetical protein [Streptomyces herbicida]|uniref:hypothetical protein n=1 Tax=Streptomyces herbicida TaxID=3065675 RepID=UPI00292DC7C9|nr:hypothetical protein [Streptomyces sp. NEAU-HV9]
MQASLKPLEGEPVVLPHDQGDLEKRRPSVATAPRADPHAAVRPPADQRPATVRFIYVLLNRPRILSGAMSITGRRAHFTRREQAWPRETTVLVEGRGPVR